jgi:hypothetical protein
LPDGGSDIFLTANLDTPNQLEIAHEIRFFAQRILGPIRRIRRTPEM